MQEPSLILGIISDMLGDIRKSNPNKGQYSYDCPNCSTIKGVEADGKGNLEVNVADGVFNCWACGQSHNTHGNLYKLFKKFGTKSHFDQLKKIGLDLVRKEKKKEENLELKELELPEEFKLISEVSKKDLDIKRGVNYLKKRGITDDIIEKHNIGICMGGEYGYRIVLPSYDIDNNVNYFVGRSFIDAKLKYKNPDIPKESIIFNEKLINWDSTVYIVEGPFDHIVVYNSIPMLGKHMSDYLVKTLMDKCNSNVVLVLDGDAWETSKMLYKKLNVGRLFGKVRVVKLPQDEDISNINQQYGRAGVVKFLMNKKKLKESIL